MKSIKRILLFSTIFLIAAIFVSCEIPGDINSIESGGSINGNPGGTPGINTGNQTSEYNENTSSRDITLQSYDLEPEFTNEIVVDLTAKTIDGIAISEKKTKTSTSDKITFKYENNLIKINTENYEGNLAFTLSGTIDGYGIQIKGNNSYAVKLTLNGANITSSSTPCLIFNTTGKSYLVLSGVNNLTDKREFGVGYSEEEGTDFYTSSFTGNKSEDAELTAKWSQGDNSKGTVYAKGALIVGGTGSLKITESYKHGIASKDYIKVNSGTININSTGRNGFNAVNGFIMNGGAITIKGTGTNTNNQSRGIVVEGSEDNPGEGFIEINGGSLNIETVGKAITAKWDIEEDSETTETTDDPYPYVRITGGNITITTTGNPTEDRYGKVTDADGVTEYDEIKLAPEGIEGKQAVFISGGILTLNCTDDCINSSRSGSAEIEISGGNIYAVSSKNDAIDSNGSLTISGGNIVAIATNSPECAFDCDQYTFSITGGNVAGIGTSNYSEPTSSACQQGVLVLASSYLGSAGKTIAVKNSSGNVVFAFTIPTGTSLNGCVGIFSSPNLCNTGSYTLVKGAVAASGNSYNGLYTSMPTVSRGTSYSGVSFSEDYVYTAGQTGNQGAHEGPRFRM